VHDPQHGQNGHPASRPRCARRGIRRRLSAVAVAVAAAAALGLVSGAAPAFASAGPAAAIAAQARHASATSCGNPGAVYTIGGSYRANDEGGFYLAWDGKFKDALRTTGSASSLYVYDDETASAGGYCGQWYMWELYTTGGTLSGECLEYYGGTTAVIADTCTPSRASQWWWMGDVSGILGPLGPRNMYDLCPMFAESDSNGSLVSCNTNIGAHGDALWKFYPHAPSD
jgi:hypothetical protein